MATPDPKQDLAKFEAAVNSISKAVADFDKSAKAATAGITKSVGDFDKAVKAATTGITKAVTDFDKSAKAVTTGMKSFSDGVKTFSDGVKTFSSGVKTLADRLNTVADRLANALQPLTTITARPIPIKFMGPIVGPASRPLSTPDNSKMFADWEARRKKLEAPFGKKSERAQEIERKEKRRQKLLSDVDRNIPKAVPGLPQEKGFWQKSQGVLRGAVNDWTPFAKGLVNLPNVKELNGLKKVWEDAKPSGEAIKNVFWDPNKLTGKKDPEGNPIKGGFDFGDIKGANGVGKQLGAAVNLGNAAFSAYGQLKSATDVAGRGNRALRGAAAGASIGTQILPGWGTAIGAGVGALVGAIRTPEFERIQNKIKKEFIGIGGKGLELSETTARGIADVEKTQFKHAVGDKNVKRSAAVVYSLDSIIKDAGGVNEKNVGMFLPKLRDAFVMKSQQAFTGDQLTETLNKNFTAFAEHVVKTKEIASKGFVELIALNKDFGAKSQAISEFVGQQTGAVGGSVATLAGPLIKEFDTLKAKVTETDAAIATLEANGGKGTAEHASLVAQLAAQQGDVAAKTAASSAEFERLGIIALGAFNASRQAGTDMVTAVAQMGPGLDQLIALQTQYGITSQNTALTELTAFRERVVNNEALVLSAGALGEAMLALSSIGGLNTETFAALDAQGVATFERLRAANFSETESLAQMKEFLESAKEAHDNLNLPLSETVEGYIKMAQETGILKKDATDTNQVMENFGESVEDLNKTVATMASTFQTFASVLGEALPTAAGLATDAIGRIPTRVEIDARLNYSQGDMPSPGGGGDYPGYANGTGGFRNFGRGTMAMLHGWEAVIPMNQLGGGGGGQGIEVNVWLNDDIIGRAAARGLPAMLDVYGATR